MKKLTVIISIVVSTIVILFAPSEALAQRISTETHFTGERITGVSASSIFEVRLVKSIQTRAVVEVSDILESYIRISRDDDGVVSINMRDWDRSVNRAYNRLPERDRVIRLTLYLPSINTIRLSGVANLSTSDAFTGEDVDIQLSGACNIRKTFSIASRRLKIQCSGASNASMSLPATRDLVVVASGACNINVAAEELTHSKIGASGACNIKISGNGETGDWSASGASRISADEFAAKDISVAVSGASSARVNASGTLTTKTSGTSSVRYAGTPASINNLSTSSVRPL
jgi:hypothetical protein